MARSHSAERSPDLQHRQNKSRPDSIKRPACFCFRPYNSRPSISDSRFPVSDSRPTIPGIGSNGDATLSVLPTADLRLLGLLLSPLFFLPDPSDFLPRLRVSALTVSVSDVTSDMTVSAAVVTTLSPSPLSVSRYPRRLHKPNAVTATHTAPSIARPASSFDVYRLIS